MGNAIEHLHVLYNNPFIFAKIFHSFYAEIKEKNNGILLSYLVLPLVLYPPSQRYLIGKSHANSGLRILANDPERIYGLPGRVQEYVCITNETLQYAIDNHIVEIGSNYEVIIKNSCPVSYVSPPNSCKAAQRLGRFMDKFDIITSYRMLGVKEL